MKSSNELPCLSSPPIDNNQIDCLSPATPNIIYSPLIYYDNQSTNENWNEFSLNENHKTIANVNQNTIFYLVEDSSHRGRMNNFLKIHFLIRLQLEKVFSLILILILILFDSL